MKEFNIEEELNKLPHLPGVYLMHNNTEQILYVGKAVDLHNRVRQYFRRGHGHNDSPKINKMVTQIAYFEYIITSSEMEALILECNLIKEYHPKYNTLMTDDKGYPYIKITSEEDFPRVLFSHSMSKNRSQYFGPYTDAASVHNTLLLIRKLFLIRNCNKDIGKCIENNDRPCLYYQIGQCSAPCAGLISKEDYNKNIDEVISFLNGHSKKILSILDAKMKKESEKLDFENAAHTRDLIVNVKSIMQKQLINDTGKSDDRDIIALAKNDDDCVISIFFIRNGSLLGRENHHMSADASDTDCDIITAFVKQYYSSTPYIPKEIITTVQPLDKEIISAFLTQKRGSKVTFITPFKGEKKGLIKLAEDNAKLILSQDIERIKRHEKRTIGACNEIARIINISSASRMEAFDISHISGYHSVASMVVFENGEPKRNSYRKFRLTTIDGPDDYASMKEVLSRRFTDDKLTIYPDVLMMDGGKGQVNIAESVLNSLGIDIPVCGMVKDDNHKTRALYYQNKIISFQENSEAMNMITALQDETHRFAITYHKLLRSKEQVHSILDDIPGIGPKRRKTLLLAFHDIENIKEASIDDLSKIDGMNINAAKSVYDFFH